jgi:hypothetical protein
VFENVSDCMPSPVGVDGEKMALMSERERIVGKKNGG